MKVSRNSEIKTKKNLNTRKKCLSDRSILGYEAILNRKRLI